MLTWDAVLDDAIMKLPIRDYRIEIHGSERGDVLKIFFECTEEIQVSQVLDVIKDGNNELYEYFTKGLIGLELHRCREVMSAVPSLKVKRIVDRREKQ